MRITEYRKALALGQKECARCRSHGCSPYLPVLSEILAAEETCGEVSLGLVDLPLEVVVGTKFAGRSKSFSHSFLPLMEEDTEFAAKWMALCHTHMEEGIQDPIQVYEYMRTFYVQEGHKRVSVLRYFDAVTVPAYVTRILPVQDESRGSRLYYEFVDFYQLTGINYLWFSGYGRFARLQAAVGKPPEAVWTEEERRDFFSFYLRFSSVYGDKGTSELTGYLTTGDALLIVLELFGYEPVKDCTASELRTKFLLLREVFTAQPDWESGVKKLLQWLSQPVRAVTDPVRAALRPDGRARRPRTPPRGGGE